jgi:hypothetical protein
MHPTHTRPGIPARTCQECGEFLPHSCAPIVTITRQKWTGRRIVTITDPPTAGGEAA